MPYKLRQMGGGYVVESDSGKRMSKRPMPKFMAARQMRALYAKEKAAHKEAGALMVFKDSAGQYRWVAWPTNAYQDDDREIVSRKALLADVDRTDAIGDHGPLLWWHEDGAVLGRCDFRAVIGRVLVESGTFKSKAIAEGVARKAKYLGLSIGFKYPRPALQDGVFHTINTFERSLLPASKAANHLTRFLVVEADMASLAEKVKQLAVLVGLEKAEEVIGVSADIEVLADKEGLAFKQAQEPEDAAEGIAVPEDEAEKAAKEEDAPEESAEEDKPAESKMDKKLSELTVGEFIDLMSAIFDEEGVEEKEADEESQLDVEKLQADLDAALTRVKELEASARVPRGYVASEADDTVKEDSRVKSAQPHADDGLKQFTEFLTNGN